MKNTKHLIAAAIAAAVITTNTNTHAELTGKQFEQVTNWAQTRGFFYRGIERIGATECFVFNNRQSAPNARAAFVPTSSDTPDEGINALIASSATYDWAMKLGHEVVAEVRREEREARAATPAPVATPAPAPAPAAAPRVARSIPDNVFFRIRADAQAEWPHDYEMQRYVIKTQVEAYEELNN